MLNSDKPQRPEGDFKSEDVSPEENIRPENNVEESHAEDQAPISAPSDDSDGTGSAETDENEAQADSHVDHNASPVPDETAVDQTAAGQAVDDQTVDDQTAIGQAIDDQTVDEQEDATIVLNDPRETRMTSIGESSPAPVSNSGTKNDRTIIESELRQSGSGSKQSLPPKQKGTHETVSRWESEQRYQLVNNFARGGLGQIWMANDVRLRREVAYKELLPKALRSANAVERFLEEAQITGQLEHPSIVPVYDIGYQQNGTPFYSMKLVRGETMEKHIEHLHELPKNSPEFTLARRRLLGNFIDICNAIAFAHDRGVLHRDLKPLNVMLGAFGETLVLDWGLAKVLDNPDRKDDPDKTTKPLHQEGIDTDCETLMQTTDQSDTAESGTTGPAADSRPVSALPVSGTAAGGTAAGAAENSAAASFTMEDSQSILGETKRYVKTDVRTAGTETMMGSIMGTPAYMPPEQAKGNLDELDARTDIYSLGGILYKLLTNEQPIQKTKAIKKLLERIIAGDITPPRRHDPQIEKPLEAVCLKAMARIQDDRYACALTLAADVEAFLADEPVSCFNDPPLVKARRWMKQNPRKVVSTGTTLAAGFLVWLGSVAVHASTLAEIREFAQDQLRDAQKQEQNNQFDDATTAITEAIGRTGSEPDLSDLTESLNNRLEKIATSQLQHIRSGTEPLLQIAIRSIADGRFEDAQSELVRVQEQTDDHESLKDLLHTANTLWAEAEDEINEKTAITQASLNFTRFRELADETRAYSSLPGSANPREDAQLAMSTGQTALRSFSLIQDQPFREPPRWFEKHLHWVREFHEAHGESPLEVLYDEAFELMILQADLEMTLASNQTDRTVIDAAGRALIWIDRAESIPDHAQTQIAQVWKAVCLRSLGKLEEAAATVATASTLEPDGVLDFFLLGEKARKDSRYDEALRHYLNVIREDPGHFWTRYYMGLCYVQLGYPHAAVSAFSNAVTLEEGNVWPVMMRAVAYAQLQMYEESLSDYTAAIELQPGLFNIYVNRGFAYLKMGRHEDALQDYQSAVKLAPESAIPHINIAAWYFERARQIREGDGDFANMQDLERIPQENEALRMAEKALDRAEQADKSGSNPRVDLLRAKIALGRGEEDIALTLFKKHSDLAPTRAIRTESLKQIGFIQFRKQQFPEALAAFQQSLELVSDDAETVFLLGETHLRLRQPEKALDYYQKFDEMARNELQSEISRPEALYTGIATALSNLGRKNDAIEYYTLAIKHNKDLAVAITKRGWAYAADGLQLARVDFENSKKLNPENADTLIGLGFTLARLGDWEAAEKELNNGVIQARKQIAEARKNNGQETMQQGWILFFNAATGYAQAFNVARGDSSVPIEQRKINIGRLFQATLQQLDEAVRLATPLNQTATVIKAIEMDSTLDPVRSQSLFQEILRKARTIPRPGGQSDAAANRTN